MPHLIVTTDKLSYGKKTLIRNQEFEASERDAALLKKIGGAADAPSRPKHVDLPKTEVKEAPAEPDAPLPGRYQRRDMRATDGQTGEETQSSSSRRGRRPKEPGSTSQEDDAEQ